MSADSSPRVFTDVSADPFVRGLLHYPANSNGKGLALTHGSGSNCQTPLLVAMAEAFAGAGFAVLRCDLPYRQDRPYGPPGPGDAKRDRQGLKNAAAALEKIVNGPVFLGGHSYGGRQASMLCAELPEEERKLIPGLLLMSYPLHPPRKPAQLRTQHFPALLTPALFVHGTRDPYATIAELEQSLKLIQGPSKLMVIDGAGHDLGFKGKASARDLPGKVSMEFQSFFTT
jgi:predicted alpha/beta-hydrolase family hydrolase